MTEENKIVEEEQCRCFCKSKGFRKFLVVTTGTFVGVFLALSLFTALHKPPMPALMPCPCEYHQMAKPHHNGGHHFDRGERGNRGEFHKKGEHATADKKAPMPPKNQANRPAKGELK